MKICVTGGSGFIGDWFCRAYAARGDQVVILDLVEPKADLPHERYVFGDVRDPEAVRDAFQGCDAVLHLAAAHHDFGISESTYFAVNQHGTQVLCDVMDELNIRSICFYSTVAVYGSAPPPLTETTIPQPESPYGRSKLAGEQALSAWANHGAGRRCLVIRPTVTFGPGNFANMYSLIRQIESGRFFQAGAATNIKSLSYVENIMAATLFLWERAGSSPFEVYNWVEKPDMTSAAISASVATALGRQRIRKLPLSVALLMAKPFDLMIAMTGRNIPVSTARVKKLFVEQTKFESDKARDHGFAPAISLDDAIARMVRWYVDGGREAQATWHQPPPETVKRSP